MPITAAAIARMAAKRPGAGDEREELNVLFGSSFFVSLAVGFVSLAADFVPSAAGFASSAAKVVHEAVNVESNLDLRCLFRPPPWL